MYIPKKDKQFAELLAKKRYLSLLLDDLYREKDAIDYYLRHHKTSRAEDMLIKESEYQKLLSSTFKSHSQEILEWKNSQYQTNNKYPEKRIYKTASGNMVRSKSEVLIDMALYMNNIPFRYECELCLGEVVLYPDFTLKHPETGRVRYWEHFGRMDDEKYAKHAAERLKVYIEHGITPNIDLIITCETQEHPLDYEMVEKVVKDYLGQR